LSSEEVMARALRTGMMDGHLTKQLRTAGDGAAVALTKLLGDRSLSDPEIETILVFLSDAFSDLAAVQVAPDREPRATLLLLKYLSCVTQNPELRRKMVDTRQRALDAYAKVTGTQ
jgi:hypothetical protein